MNLKSTIDKFLNKKSLIVIFFAGILLMMLPDFSSNNKEIANKVEFAEKIDESKLEKILKKINGVDDVDVFITYRNGGTVNYAYDIKNSNNQHELEIKMSDKSPVVSGTINPKVDGILAVVKGEYFDETELYSAVKAATGVPLHRICIKKS